MRGYRDDSYGEAFADVYDDWYADVSDVAATVDTVAELARRSGGTRVLELGVGTGRLALPIAATGLEVHGVDASESMLERLRTKPGADRLHLVLGDMVDDAPPGPFDVVLVAYNTFFNLPSEQRQALALRTIADRLAPAGRLAIEVFVPDDAAPAGSTVSVRSLEADRVVLSVERHHPGQQRAEGQFVELSEAGGVRLRPWSIRWARPEQLDAMALRAGLVLEERWSGFERAPFDDDSTRHVSIYRIDPALDAHGRPGDAVSSEAS